MKMINGKEWYAPLVGAGFVNELSDFAGGATKNECRLSGINHVWYHYPTIEEALEGLKIRDHEEWEIEMEYIMGEHFEWVRKCVECESIEHVFTVVKERGLTKFDVDTNVNYPGVFFLSYKEKKFSPRGSLYTICHEDGSRDGIEWWGFRIHK